MSDKKLPNILVVGTPAVGKSHLCEKLKQELNFNWHDVSAIAREKGFTEEMDQEYDCPILDEEKLMDYLEPIMSAGGNIVEYHSCEFFPERWFDAVFVVRCDNTILYDRLYDRGYNPRKLQSNLECEIFQTIVQEAQGSYRYEIVFQLQGDTEQDCNNSVEQVKQWYKSWKNK